MWISKPSIDIPFIIAPAFLSTLLVLVLFFLGIIPKTVSPLQWLILVVFIDVAHVWSTIYRTYLNEWGKKTFSTQLWLVPLSCYLGGVILHAMGPFVFWRTLAYMAVFHFVRQQYGFFMIYKRKEIEDSRFELFDKIVIYSSTVIPLFIWHFRGQQSFNWFIKEDFFYLPFPLGEKVFLAIGVALLVFYLLKEKVFLKSPLFSPKNLILFGTALAWYVGIVFIPTDWSFTVTNVVSHGIPYFALIYLAHFQKEEDKKQMKLGSKVPTFFLFSFLIVIGFMEEGFWDSLIWRDNENLFGLFYLFNPVGDLSLKALLVPLLALPQSTHYVLDGFIWKTRLGEK